MPSAHDSQPAVPAATPRRPRVRSRLRTPLEARAWRRKVTGYVLFAAAFVLMVNALIGENGYLATMQARGQREQLAMDVARARLRNRDIAERIDRIRHDPAALDEAARRGLNMIKPGETQIIIRDVQKAPAPPLR